MKKGNAISWVTIFVAGFVWSAIAPKDYFTWLLEVFPALIAFAVVAATRSSFPLTPLVYILILIHCFILFVGGHYTYAEVPLFDWIKEWGDQDRNNYDKVGHFAQGFIPAIIAREILLRKQVVTKHSWLAFLCVCICMAISALYEFIEWFVAEMSGQSADAFLGTQGYVWDTQSDMLMATIGAICALTILARLHNAQLSKL